VGTAVQALGSEELIMKIKSLSPFYLFFGLVCGLLLGLSLGHETSVVVTKIVFFLSIAVIALFGRQIDEALHNSDVRDWHFLRAQSRWYFVLTRYILLRGIALFTLFVLPMIATVRFSKAVVLAVVLTIALIMVILTFFGLSDWRRCEQEYTIRLLKNAGEQARIAQN